MVAELGLYSHDKEKRNCERDVRRRSMTGQIEKELKEVMHDDGSGTSGYEEFMKMVTHKS